MRPEDEQFLEFGSSDASASDIYLQPHSDDVCFSLGALAHRRHRGILLTIFPISAYVPRRPGDPPPSRDWVTSTRIMEDKAFATACGLDARFLTLHVSSLLGHAPFDLSRVNENLQRVKSALMNALIVAQSNQTACTQPWLFCPSGIGGHVDHVAVRMLVHQNYEELSAHYRIGFYEDLHYASSRPAREAGLHDLLQGMPGRRLSRHAFPLKEYLSKKIALIQLYKSQFLTLPRSIEQFTPAADFPDMPHEAVWC